MKSYTALRSLPIASVATWSALIAVGTVLASVPASAQEFPSKPLRMVVGFVAGSGVDVSGRIVAQFLSEAFNQPVVVENRPGMASIVAARDVSKATADGYTLFMCTTSSHVTGPFLTRQQPYDPIKDFTLIAQVVESYLVAAAPATIPPNTLKEFAAWAKANSGKVYYASPGVGGSSHLLAERFNRGAGLGMTHVPYKGSGVPELASGETQLLFALPATVNIGPRLKLLAVSAPKEARVTPELEIKAFGQVYSVKSIAGVIVGQKLLVARNPWDTQGARVATWDSEGNEVWQPVNALEFNEWGFRETAAMLGEEPLGRLTPEKLDEVLG